VFPAFRPDSALAIDQPGFAAYLDTLGRAAGVTIATVDDLLTALEKRLDVFVAHGCRAADHGLERPPFVLYPEKELTRVFNDALAGRTIFHGAADAFRTTVLTALAHMYAVRGLAMEVHLSVIRSVSAVSRQRLGPNTGFDAATDGPVSVALAGLLSHIEETGDVPRMIFFTLNPKDYYPLLTVMGGFQDNREGGVCGKMQLGSAWWFLDHRDGMEEQMRLFANGGLLSSFIGMLTDSRSFLSYPRHEYFRRILCNLLGRWVENGEYPADMPRLTEIVRGISFGNAEAYFG
jgi:glucuronate isomerase